MILTKDKNFPNFKNPGEANLLSSSNNFLNEHLMNKTNSLKGNLFRNTS